MATPELLRHVLLEEVPAISHAEAMVLAHSQNEGLLRDLKQLAPADWDKPTDCTGWSVRDIVAHVLGWAEAMTSVREATKQTVGAVRGRGAFSNLVDAQNEIQVSARRWLSTDELISRLETAFPRFVKVRDRAGKVLRRVPYFSAPMGWTNLGFIADHIFTRDVLMHRIDIARALRTELIVGGDESRVIEDCMREWAENSRADMTLELAGAAAGRYVSGAGAAATLRGDSIDLLRYMAGRESLDAFEISGDKESALVWLRAGMVF